MGLPCRLLRRARSRLCLYTPPRKQTAFGVGSARCLVIGSASNPQLLVLASPRAAFISGSVQEGIDFLSGTIPRRAKHYVSKKRRLPRVPSPRCSLIPLRATSALKEQHKSLLHNRFPCRASESRVPHVAAPTQGARFCHGACGSLWQNKIRGVQQTVELVPAVVLPAAFSHLGRCQLVA